MKQIRAVKKPRDLFQDSNGKHYFMAAWLPVLELLRLH
jgi:hypothetical protein